MKKIIIIVFIFILLAISYVTFVKESTIKIGFVGSLSERFARLGNDSLNSVKLAFEEIDYKIGNNKIELVIKDDAQDKTKAKQSIDELIAENVKLIIGNITSSMTKVSLEAIKGKDMILVSPTAKSKDLINKDDNLLRIQDTYSSKSFEPLLNYLRKKRIKKLLCFYSEGHQTTKNKYLIDFQKLFVNTGGEKFIQTIKIDDDTLEEMVKKIDKNKTDGVLILSGSVVSAKVIQFLKRGGFDKQIIVTEWATNSDFLENGGKAIEGTVLITDYIYNSQSKSYQAFVKAYENRFGKTPSPYAMNTYESAKIIIEVLKKDNNINNVKKNILNQKVFEGLQGKIRFNKYGDVTRDHFLIEVKNNRFITIDE